MHAPILPQFQHCGTTTINTDFLGLPTSPKPTAEYIIVYMFWVKFQVHPITLQWRHNGHNSVSNHQPHDCLLNLLFSRRSKKISKFRVTGLCARNSQHKGPVTRKIFPFDDVIMKIEKFQDANFVVTGGASGFRHGFNVRADSRFAPSQREMTLLCHDVSHWLGASLESAMECTVWKTIRVFQ